MSILLLGVIGADLGDAACDPFPLALGGSLRFATAPESADACFDFCIPDCFCCTPSAPAAPAFSLPRAESASEGPAAPAESLVAGVLSVIDHIPIAAP